MAEVIRMPLLSDTMTEGKIVKWNKKVGDHVKSDDSLADVETDKATMEVIGYADGTLLYIGINEGEAAKVNDIIAIVGAPGEDIQPYLANASVATPAAITSTQSTPELPASAAPSITPEQLGVTVIRMPLLSDTMTSGKIVQWNKKVGDSIKSDDNLADVETDKATMEVIGYTDGTLLYIGLQEGESAKINDVIAIIGKAGTDISALLPGINSSAAPIAASQPVSTAQAQTTNTPAVAANHTTHSSDNRLKASPLAKLLAKEKGLDLNQIAGSGDGGRITKKDVDEFKDSATALSAAAPVAKTTVFGVEGYSDTQLTSMRKTIARRLGESMFTAPHFYLTMEINMDNAMKARAEIRTCLSRLLPYR